MRGSPIAPGYGHRYLPWLRAARRAKGWSQEYLALETDVAEQTIRRIEAGGAAKLQTMHRLAYALDVPAR